MLSDSEIHANIPARDLKRARAFYTEVLGLTPAQEDDVFLTFRTPSGSWFQIYETASAGTGKHTVAQFDVDDIESEVAALRAKGVVFDQFELPGTQWDDGIASGPMGRAAWFRDSEDNVLCLDQRAAAPV